MHNKIMTYKHPGIERRIKKKDKAKIWKEWLKFYGKKKQHGREGSGEEDNTQP